MAPRTPREDCNYAGCSKEDRAAFHYSKIRKAPKAAARWWFENGTVRLAALISGQRAVVVAIIRAKS
jgi:hypothetical protein